MTEHVTFIGLGNMGGPMAANLARAGKNLTVFDLTPQAAEPLLALGAKSASRVVEAVIGADVVVSMLPSGREVHALYLGETNLLAQLKPGSLIIDCSTIDVATARQVHQAAQAAGVDMLDAPVSGGVVGAQNATLTFMVGGSEHVFNRGREILALMGAKLVHAGDAGNGQVAKICNNMLLGISMIGVAEAFQLGTKLGLSPEKLFEISSSSSGQCWSMTSYCPVPGLVPSAPSNRDYTGGFRANMMLKDLNLAQAAARDAGVATPLGGAATQLYQLMSAAGLGDLDFSGIIKLLAKT